MSEDDFPNPGTDRRPDELKRHLASEVAADVSLDRADDAAQAAIRSLERADDAERAASLSFERADDAEARADVAEKDAGDLFHTVMANRGLINLLALMLIILLPFVGWMAYRSSEASIDSRDAIERVELEAFNSCLGGAVILAGFNKRFATPLREFLRDAARARRVTSREPALSRSIRRLNRATAARYDKYREMAKDFPVKPCKRPKSLGP